jgi:hypothetical protein
MAGRPEVSGPLLILAMTSVIYGYVRTTPRPVPRLPAPRTPVAEAAREDTMTAEHEDTAPAPAPAPEPR